MNQLNIIGNISLEPTYRTVDTARGQATVCSFSVAVNEYYQGKENTTYFRVSLWNALADRASKILTIGSLVFVSGKVRLSSYTDRDANEKSSLEIMGRDFSLLRKNQNAEPIAPSNKREERSSYTAPAKSEGYVDLRKQEYSSQKVKDMPFQESVFGRTKDKQSHVASAGTNKYHRENTNQASNYNVRREDIKEDEGDDYE